MNPSIDDIQEVMKIFLDSGLKELRLEIGDVRLAVSRNGSLGAFTPLEPRPAPALATAATAVAVPAAAAAPAAAPAAAEAVGPAAVPSHWVAVPAPSLGVFYRRAAPDQPPFVQIGDLVEADAPICLIEVMKMYNRVTAPCKGRIAAILVEDGKMVEFGQTLVHIEPA